MSSQMLIQMWWFCEYALIARIEEITESISTTRNSEGGEGGGDYVDGVAEKQLYHHLPPPAFPHNHSCKWLSSSIYHVIMVIVENTIWYINHHL